MITGLSSKAEPARARRRHGTRGYGDCGPHRLSGDGAAAGNKAALGQRCGSRRQPHGLGEIKWPLPADLWSVGKAFKCNQADCGGDIALYLRAKIGFCNCVTGVADDEELKRLADIQLFGGKHLAEGPGRPIAVAWM